MSWSHYYEILKSEDPLEISFYAKECEVRLTVQYALEGITNQLFVSRYQLYLPDRDTLSGEVYRIIEAHVKEKADKNPGGLK